ncbi:MAG TPA: DNA-processing protein DprA [Terriglobia bacterium]|nr:DNA-processing protein DprA [Terriglobia bacterium]
MIETSRNTRAALRLALVRGLGVRSANALLRHFKSARAVVEAGRGALEQQGIPPDIAEDLAHARSAERVEQELERAAALGVQVVDASDPQYPPLLREIFDPPVVLYIKGQRWVADAAQIGIVGTRRPTGYGINCAERFAEDLAQRGLVVTSGLARGIDAAAHRGAVRTGATLAVFGCGLDFVYPRENRKLAEIVEKNGALISEFPLGAPPSPENFPIRNRIIAGMALGVLVVEAAEYSGSLITARLALENNREVFAAPGAITSPNSFGPHALIRQGARLVTGWQDVVEELPAPVREKILTPLMARARDFPSPELDGVDRRLWDLMSLETPVSIDVLLDRAPGGAAEIYGALLRLEEANWVRQLPGKKYVRRL